MCQVCGCSPIKAAGRCGACYQRYRRHHLTEAQVVRANRRALERRQLAALLQPMLQTA